MFLNRSEAGQLLARRLKHYKGLPAVVLAVPRGGVPVAFEVSKELELPLDIVLVKKLGHPTNPEYAIGAVGLDNVFVVPHDEVTQAYIEKETERVRSRLREMNEKFRGGKKSETLDGKIVIVVDDGIATGNTLLATVQLLRQTKNVKIVIAAPVASRSAVDKLARVADEVVTVGIPPSFRGVGAFYRNFQQVNDDEVVQCLQKLQAGKV